MKIIHRYVLKEVISSFVFGFLFFNFILFIGVIFELMELIFIENIPVLRVGKLVLFKVPAFFDIVIPVSVLFAALLSFGRLSSDGEITALRSSGVSLLQVGTPLLAFALSLTLISLYFSAYLTPWCNQHYKETYYRILLERPTLQIKERTITDLKGKKLYTYHLNPESYEMEEIVIYEFLPGRVHRFPQLTLAKKGKFTGKTLQLKDVTVYRIGENYRITQRGKFSSQTIYLDKQISGPGIREKATEEMDLRELGKRLKEERIKERPNEEKIRKLAVDFHTRIAIPLATLFIALLAIPLGIKLGRGEKSISLGISLLIIIIYYLLLLAGQFLGKGGIISPFLAIWLPNLLITAGAIWLNLRIIKL